ncbi:MAG: hypothetical protein RJB38_2133 [Pseudomonadota bacterium]|jgi:predicted  nucleic acid-binding Zn-ribbon protein
MRSLIRQFLDPEASASRRWTGAIVLAVMLTGSLRWADEALARRYQQHYGAIIARQIASQAEGLSLGAAQRNLRDPVGWTLFQLSQGIEPRYVQLSRTNGETTEGLEPSDPATVSYRKPLTIPGQSEHSGVRIHVKLPEAGFLGGTTPLSRDLRTLAVAVTLATLFGLALQLRSTQHSRALLGSRQSRLGDLIPQLREVLLAVGRQLRDLFRQFEMLGSASHEALENVRRARSGFHEAIQKSRSLKKQIDHLAGLTMQAEVSALNVMLGKSSVPAHVLHQQITELRAFTTKAQESVRQLEIGLEPLTTDMDLSFQALKEAQNTLKAVPDEIQKTSEKMTDQAKVFQSIRDLMAG